MKKRYSRMLRSKIDLALKQKVKTYQKFKEKNRKSKVITKMMKTLKKMISLKNLLQRVDTF